MRHWLQRSVRFLASTPLREAMREKCNELGLELELSTSSLTSRKIMRQLGEEIYTLLESRGWNPRISNGGAFSGKAPRCEKAADSSGRKRLEGHGGFPGVHPNHWISFPSPGINLHQAGEDHGLKEQTAERICGLCEEAGRAVSRCHLGQDPGDSQPPS